MTQKIKDVFVFYREYVKPLYCEIEAKDNTLPVELLFEIHAAFDHLRRYFVDGEDESVSTRRAIGHLKRGSLDAFKLKLKFFHEDIEKLLSSGPHLDFVDNSEFLPSLLSDKQKIITTAKSARLQESNQDPDLAYDLWTKTSLAIDEFYEKYLSNLDKIKLVEIKAKKWLNVDKKQGLLIGSAIGLLTGFISSYAVWWLTKS